MTATKPKRRKVTAKKAAPSRKPRVRTSSVKPSSETAKAKPQLLIPTPTAELDYDGHFWIVGPRGTHQGPGSNVQITPTSVRGQSRLAIAFTLRNVLAEVREFFTGCAEVTVEDLGHGATATTHRVLKLYVDIPEKITKLYDVLVSQVDVEARDIRLHLTTEQTVPHFTKPWDDEAHLRMND